MKLALVTTSRARPSGIGDYVRHLLPYLREHAEVRLFVEPGAPADPEEEARPADRLVPREHDQVLFQLGNEQGHGFMARMVRALGGTVAQHDWVLFDMALRAYPALARGGGKGHLLALREGGAAELRVYASNWLARRRQRVRAAEVDGAEAAAGRLIAGWHEPEPGGRWTGDRAALRIPARGVEEVEIDVSAERRRSVRLLHAGRTLAVLREGRNGSLLAARALGDEPLLAIETRGITVTREQRRHGDARRLGCFVRRVRWRDALGWSELPLDEPAAFPIVPVTLSRDRFRLPLNRSVVRFGDAFVVHSRYVAERIQRDRNTATPIGIVPHGAERRWREEDDRRVARRRLGLPAEWAEGFLAVSFGGVQRHKRIDPMLAALALARRERPDVRLVLAGGYDAREYDPAASVRRHGLEDAVRLTGFVAEDDAREWIHAADVCLNLRGPTSGGTSGGIFQTFSAGRAVIATGAAEQAELPDSCVVKVPLGEGEVEAIARTLVALRDDPDRLRRLEEGARRFVDTECHWSHVAKRYAELLEHFPAPRSARRRLLSLARG